MSIFHQRLQRVRQQMAQRGIELLILPPSPYLFYVSGIQEQSHFDMLKGSGDWLNGLFIGLDNGPIFVVNWEVHRLLQRQSEVLSEVITDVEVLEQRADPFELLKGVLDRFKPLPRRVAVSDRTWVRFSDAVRVVLPAVEIVMAAEFMDQLLAIKDDEALRRMQNIARLTDAVYSEVLKCLRLGVTEAEVALEVDYQFRKLGADENSFRTSVVFTRPGDLPPKQGKRLEPGDSIIFDFGGVAEGYCSDFGRSAFAGEPPSEYLQLHNMIRQAQTAGMQAMKANQTRCEEIVDVVHQVLIQGGYGEYLIPAVGHSIGMTVHEAPLLFSGDRTIIQAGMTFTVEPTMRVPGRFSNRVEDVVLVTETGTQYLTNFSRDLHIVS